MKTSSLAALPSPSSTFSRFIYFAKLPTIPTFGAGYIMIPGWTIRKFNGGGGEGGLTARGGSCGWIEERITIYLLNVSYLLTSDP